MLSEVLNGSVAGGCIVFLLLFLFFEKGSHKPG